MSDQENTEQEVVESTEEVVTSNAVALPLVYGFKKGMSAIYNDAGVRVPVTVLECSPWTVTQVKTQDTDGYDSVQISFGVKKAKNAGKSEAGHVKAAGCQTGYRFSREVKGAAPEGCAPGKQVSLEKLEVGKKVQVTATSKGRGFSGVMKRHGFAGGPASHGSGFHRRPGSAGMCTFPGRIMPGKKMPGQYGNKTATVQGLEIVGVNVEENIVLLKGAVPGPVNGLVKIATKG
ncbi:MAG: 50S ribosomal protein L3 [Bdellovibrionales bacterium]